MDHLLRNSETGGRGDICRPASHLTSYELCSIESNNAILLIQEKVYTYFIASEASCSDYSLQQ